MKANELRIGNFIEYNSVLWYVSEIRSPKPLKHTYYSDKFIIELYNAGLIDAVIDDISPIPLTEEWLLKFGFELQYGFGGVKRYYKDRYLIEDGISMFFDNGFSFRITTDAQNSTHAKSVKYVHQLQNLCFALTGNELTTQNG